MSRRRFSLTPYFVAFLVLVALCVGVFFLCNEAYKMGYAKGATVIVTYIERQLSITPQAQPHGSEKAPRWNP